MILVEVVLVPLLIDRRAFLLRLLCGMDDIDRLERDEAQSVLDAFHDVRSFRTVAVDPVDLSWKSISFFYSTSLMLGP
jgi:hypothetical protein